MLSRRTRTNIREYTPCLHFQYSNVSDDDTTGYNDDKESITSKKEKSPRIDGPARRNGNGFEHN